VIGIVMNVRPLRFFSWHPIVALGTISYGLYLWHQTLLLYFVWNLRSTRDIAVLPRAAIVLGSSLLIATASWFTVERPLQRFTRRRREGSSTAPAAAAGT
jgi:peptidoglycan/LPS O-acetylase OafA/YrhL